MKKVIVIGGGLSGLSAAVTLIKKNVLVNILEAAPQIGGRAKAFNCKYNNILLDNGQHLLLSCYKDSLEFLRTIASDKNILIKNRLELPFIFKGRKKYVWEIPDKYYPFNLLKALKNFKLLSFKSRLKLMAQLSLLLSNKAQINETVEEWLNEFSNDKDSLKYFWEMIGIGALNTSFYEASSFYFKNILREMFVKNRRGYKFIVPRENLTEFYCRNAINYITGKGSKISTSERVRELFISNNRLTQIITARNTIRDFSGAIIAVPLHQLKKVLPSQLPADLFSNYEPSEIVSAHVFLDREVLNEDYAYLVDSKFDWIFNHGKYKTLVKSNAKELASLSKLELKNLIKTELKEYFPVLKDSDFLHIEIIKERRATFKTTPRFSATVSKFKPNYENLEFAGDWIFPDMPATIESAVKSGRIAAEKLLKRIH